MQEFADIVRIAHERFEAVKNEMPCPECGEKGKLEKVSWIGTFVCQNSAGHKEKTPRMITVEEVQAFIKKRFSIE